jgi:ribosomal protein S8
MAKKEKKEKPSYEYNGTKLDSKEEVDFCKWAQEALEHGFLESWAIHKEPYILSEKKTRTVEVQLKTKVKTKELVLLNKHVYTPDFTIKTTKKFEDMFPNHGLVESTGEPNVYIIDTKGSFAKNDGGRSFSINQKWLYETHSIYVNKVIASGNNKKNWFIRTWVPYDTRWTAKYPGVRVQLCYQNVPTIKDIK